MGRGMLGALVWSKCMEHGHWAGAMGHTHGMRAWTRLEEGVQRGGVLEQYCLNVVSSARVPPQGPIQDEVGLKNSSPRTANDSLQSLNLPPRHG